MVFTLFQCVAESVVAKGVVSLAREIPFGTTLYDVATDAWKRFRGKKAAAEARAEVQMMAQAAADEVKGAARHAARDAFPLEPEKAIELELYLTQIPAAVRQSLRRLDDPTGTTVPLGFSLDRPEDLLTLLPARVSRFRPGSPLPGRDGWTLTELLGTGGFGEVWLASHPTFPSLKRAVKFCLDLTDADRTLLREGELIDRVMRVGSVPNVVSLIDANLSGESPWLMYEFVGGGDLVSLVAGWRGLAPADRLPRALDGLRQVAGAVAHFHKLGVVHRDLKPANILVASGAQLKVADFGIGGVSASHELAADAKVTSTGLRQATVARGAYTPVYASPQQKRGLPPDPRDDVFALGVVAYQMLVGDVTAERPGGTGWRRELQTQGVSAGVLDVLESCWDDSPTDRPRDAGELLARLDRAAGPPALPRREAPKSVAARPKSPPPPSWMKVFVGTTFFLVLVLGLLFLVAYTMSGGGVVTGTKASRETDPNATVTPRGSAEPGPPPNAWVVGDWNPTDGGVTDTDVVHRFMPNGTYYFAKFGSTATGTYRLIGRDAVEITLGPSVVAYDVKRDTADHLRFEPRPGGPPTEAMNLRRMK